MIDQRRWKHMYDFDHAVPPVRPEPVEPLKTPCIGGPWDGATITHMPGDMKPRIMQGGKYVFVGENAERFGAGAVWRWHQFV